MPFDDERRLRKVEATDYLYLAAVCWPASDPRRLWDIAAFAGTFTERDSEFDADRYGGSQAALRASVADVRCQYDTVTEPRWGPLVAEIWQRNSEYLPPGQLDRQAQVVADFLEGCIAYDERLGTGGPLADVDEYLAARFLPLGQLVDHMAVEASLGIDLGDVIDEPALQAVIRADVERVAVYQDILSLRKDLALGEDAENIVFVIARAERCPLDKAVQAACRWYDDKMAHFDAQAARLADTALGRRPDVAQFVDGLRDFTAGLIEWTKYSARYTLKDASRWQYESQAAA
jgi:hypothetical protein